LTKEERPRGAAADGKESPSAKKERGVCLDKEKKKAKEGKADAPGRKAIK